MLWWALLQLRSSNPETRAKAAQSLGAAKQKKAVPSLVQCLDDNEAHVRFAVIEALASIGHPASAEPLASALSKISKAPKSRSRSSDRGVDTGECSALAKALAAVGPPAVDALLRLLGSEDSEQRRWGAFALGAVKDCKAVDPLMGALQDSRSEVRKTASLALGEIGDARAVPALISALANRDLETRRAAAEALGAIGAEDASEALAAAVRDQSELVQLSAIGALGKIGGMQAAECLRSAAASPRRAVCEAAKAALKSLKLTPADAEERAAMAVIYGDFAAARREGSAAVPSLIRALGFQDSQMRAKAAETLGSLRSPETVPALLQAFKDHSPEVQEAAAHALVSIGAPALDGLEEALASYDASIARLAAGALGRMGNVRSVTALLEMIEGNRSISGEYPEMLDALAASVDSLAVLLRTSSAEVSQQDLERAANLPEEIRLSGSQPPRSVDCTQVRTKAKEELFRRSPETAE